MIAPINPPLESVFKNPLLIACKLVNKILIINELQKRKNAILFRSIK